MEDKVDPRPWSFNLTKDELNKIYEFALAEFLERSSGYTKPERFFVMCILEGYDRLLKSRKHET